MVGALYNARRILGASRERCGNLTGAQMGASLEHHWSIWEHQRLMVTAANLPVEVGMNLTFIALLIQLLFFLPVARNFADVFQYYMDHG